MALNKAKAQITESDPAFNPQVCQESPDVDVLAANAQLLLWHCQVVGPQSLQKVFQAH